jgi:phage tail sheath gpL-like
MPPISFNSIPANNRLPFIFVEFDNTNAVQGPSLIAYRALLIGQKLTGGSAVADVPVRVTSEAQAKTLFGEGSMLHHMCAKWFANNKSTEMWCMPLVDNGAGVAASGTLTFTGPASAAGAINLYVAGRSISVAVAAADSATTIAAAVAAAITANPQLGLTASANLGVVTYTYVHKGIMGNEIDVRLNYFEGEALPAGVGCTVVAPTGGTLNPVLATAISNMGETWYHILACAYTDAVSLTALEAELTSRFGPTRQIDGMAFCAKNVDFAALTSFGAGRNSPHVSVSSCYKHPTHPAQFAAAVASVAALYGNIDPARPFQTLPVAGELPALEVDRFTNEERNLLLFDGISTNNVDAGGVVRLERLITMYQENPLGADDPSYLDVTTLLTLSYLRYDFRNYFLLKYPRHKLADDGTRYGAGQAVITPKVARAEAIAKFRDWEELGLVENFEQFKEELIVERNVSDRNRLDFMLPPDIINQLITVAAKISFIL